MITRNPLGRNDLRIKRSDRVLEIGSGHDPMYRSNVLTDKYESDNSQRCGDIHIYPHQTFVRAEGENLPFADNTFDYVICNQVLEHAENPEQFIREVMRVGSGGYIETPSLLGELLFPKETHKWVVLPIDGKLYFYEKKLLPGNFGNNYGEVFLNYLPYQSLPYKILAASEQPLLFCRVEWRGSIECVVNTTDPMYSRYFTQKWDREMATKIFPPRNARTEIRRTLCSVLYTLTDKAKFRLLHRPKSMPLEQWIALNRKG